VLNEWSINDQRVSSPALLLVTNVFVPEPIIIIEVVNGLQQRCIHGFLGIRVGLHCEVSHNLLHFGLHLILSNVQLVLHDLSCLAISAVLVQPAGKLFHGISLSGHFILFLVHTLVQATFLALLDHFLLLFSVGAQSVIIYFVELKLIDHLFASRDVHSNLVGSRYFYYHILQVLVNRSDK